MNKSSPLYVLLILCAVQQAALAETFSFDGFSLGMSQIDASKIRPDIPWKTKSEYVPTEKVFTATYFGKPTEVSIELDPSDKFIRRIAFSFVVTTDDQCVFDAVGALAQLEKLYGSEPKDIGTTSGRRYIWSIKPELTVRWNEMCAIGALRYFVLYTKESES